MAAMRHGKSSMLPGIGVMMLLVPTYVTACWIFVFYQVDDHGERVAAFNAMLPTMLRSPVVSTVLSTLFAIGGFAVGAVGLVRLSGFRRLLSGAVSGAGGLLTAWLVWTLL